jgi:hypothetical protein
MWGRANGAEVYQQRLVPAVFGPWAPRVVEFGGPPASGGCACGSGGQLRRFLSCSPEVPPTIARPQGQDRYGLRSSNSGRLSRQTTVAEGLVR